MKQKGKSFLFGGGGDAVPNLKSIFKPVKLVINGMLGYWIILLYPKGRKQQDNMSLVP
jgi:hypothetical protein